MQILAANNQYGKGDIASNVDALPAQKPAESPVVTAAKARASKR